MDHHDRKSGHSAKWFWALMAVVGCLSCVALVTKHYGSMAFLLALSAVSLRVRDLEGLRRLGQHTGLSVQFLSVFTMIKLADWLQGPYFYDVYSSKVVAATGERMFSQGHLTALFLTGFGSGLVFSFCSGTIIDKGGRKASSMFCAVLMAVGAASVYSNNVVILYCGRFAGGAASTLLHSALDAWLTAELRQVESGTDELEQYLSQLNSLRYFLDGLLAILAGVGADAINAQYGPAEVFYTAGITAAITVPLILVLWRENYGKSSGSALFCTALAAMKSIPVWSLCLACTVFMGSMFCFVQMWVPVLRLSNPDAPIGLIFSAFMSAIMVGSTLVGIANVGFGVSSITMIVLSLLLGGGAMLMSAVFVHTSGVIVIASFLLFETAVGAHFASSGAAKAAVLDSDIQGTLLSFFRIPLNVYVLTFLTGSNFVSFPMILTAMGSVMVGSGVLYWFLNQGTVQPAEEGV